MFLINEIDYRRNTAILWFNIAAQVFDTEGRHREEQGLNVCNRVGNRDHDPGLTVEHANLEQEGAIGAK